MLLTVRAVRHTYDPGRPFRPWLVATANWRIIDRLRRQIRVRSREIELSDEHETFSSDVANLYFDDASADFAALHATIATLAPDQRLAINLLKLKEMSLKEAALARGRSVSALKVAVHRAIKALRRSDCDRRAKRCDRNSGTHRHIGRMRDASEATAPPVVRATLWLAFAGIVFVLIAVGHGVRTDLLARLDEPKFAATIGPALATGVLATIAAFMISLPDRSRWWLLLPLPALAIWITTIGYGCFADWVSPGPDGIHFGEEVRCFALLVLTSVPLAIVLAAMLCYSALLRGGAVAVIGGLAVAAITATALSLFHDHDATMLILFWNLGTTVLITGLGTLFGRGMFRWMTSRLLASQPGG